MRVLVTNNLFIPNVYKTRARRGRRDVKLPLDTRPACALKSNTQFYKLPPTKTNIQHGGFKTEGMSTSQNQNRSFNLTSQPVNSRSVDLMNNGNDRFRSAI